MLIYVLVISILIPALGGTRLEVCVCCGEEIGQSISESCEIPAKSLSTEELAAILKLCEERGLAQSDYVNVPNLLYIALNKSSVEYPHFPSKDCATILNDKWFWIPDDNPWIVPDGKIQLARKVISRNITDQYIYELIAYNNDYMQTHIDLTTNPSLNAFNGTYEFLLRAVPQQTLHDIELGVKRKIWRDEIVNLGEVHLYSGTYTNGFTNHAWVPSNIYYNINANLTKGSMLDVKDENETFYFRVGGDKQHSVIKSMTVPDVKFPPGWVLTYTVRGKWVDTQQQFTAKLRSTYSNEDSKNIFLTTEDIVTGSKFESTIELIEGEHNYSWYGTLMVSDKAMAGILFTISGLLILGVIFVCIKKVCCCCCRDTVATGYQRIDETITAVPT